MNSYHVNTVWQWDNSDPFGSNVPNENPNGAGQFGFPLRFAGQYYDRETNLHYNYFRDYDPTIGRYIQSDPIGLGGGINGYLYVENKPLLWVDESGLGGHAPGNGPYPPGTGPSASPEDIWNDLQPNTDLECLATCTAKQALMCSSIAVSAAGIGGGFTGGVGAAPAGTATYLVCQWVVQPFHCSKKCKKNNQCSAK